MATASARFGSSRDSSGEGLAERDGFEPPVPRRLLWRASAASCFSPTPEAARGASCRAIRAGRSHSGSQRVGRSVSREVWRKSRLRRPTTTGQPGRDRTSLLRARRPECSASLALYSSPRQTSIADLPSLRPTRRRTKTGSQCPLLERTGFELPVLFGLFPLGKGTIAGHFRPEFATRSLGEQFSDRL
jgi:hypothetical protein